MYLRMWIFRPRPERLVEFLAAYGPEGDWAQLFRSAHGFLGTELVRSAEDPGLYLTIDRWDDNRSWEAFTSSQLRAYAALDQACNALTLEERELGTYHTLNA